MEHLKTPFEYELCCPHDTKGDIFCLSGIFDFIFAESLGFICNFANWSNKSDLESE
jgi:hypothetical protein